MRKHMRLLTIIIALAFTVGCHAEESLTGKHLFILSGQSNMGIIKPESSFTPIVAKEFGESNVTVVKAAQGGLSISHWYTKEKSRGRIYKMLMEGVKKATEGKTYNTITFVWMQGEADAGKKGEPSTYVDSFNGMLDFLKADLEVDSINIVIGRLSDFKTTEKWTRMREIQVKLAEDAPNGAWVDTDDLNDKKGDQTKNALHYSYTGRKILGQRFAEKAIELIKKQKK
jgi:hypothetical protein